jgi:hypothetical protein
LVGGSRQKLVLTAIIILLTASLAANLVLYRQASRPLYESNDRPLIDRTIALGATRERTSVAAIEAEFFPIVMRHVDHTCVELRSYDGLGHVGACYDRAGRVVEETASVVG